MKFAHRLAFYLGGFVIGLILLFFFLGGKRTSCDYGPDARVLKNIRSKDRKISNRASSFLVENQLDSAMVSTILRKGDVLFSESNTDLDSCKVYMIVGVALNKKLKMKIENCDKIATLQEVFFVK